MITVTIVPAQSPTCLARLVCSAHRSVQRSFAVTANAVPVNGSRSTRAKVTRSPSLPACDSTQRHSIVTRANGPRAGKRFIGRHADLRRDIPLGCEFTGASALLSGFSSLLPLMGAWTAQAAANQGCVHSLLSNVPPNGGTRCPQRVGKAASPPDLRPRANRVPSP